MQNNKAQKISWGIAFGIIILALLLWVMTRPKMISVPNVPKVKQTAEVDANDPALVALKNMKEVVYRVTNEVDINFEDVDGSEIDIHRQSISKVSVTPDLQVVYLEGTHDTGKSAALDIPPQQYPSYTIFNHDGTTKNYVYVNNEVDPPGWRYGDSDELFYGVNENLYYAGTWLTDEIPHKISEGVYQARGNMADGGTYTFYFDETPKLMKVEWDNPETNDHELFEILDEEPVRSVPAEVVAAAVPFEFEE
ncbi:hypothetical protein IJJ27_01980 [bacterium]|nr:hypothetical protein [bacterium]